MTAALVATCASALGSASPMVAGAAAGSSAGLDRGSPGVYEMLGNDISNASLIADPRNTSPPTISGDAVENETLSGEIGTWIGPNLIFTRQWQRSNGSGGYDDIPGATGATYTLRLGDVGHTIRLRVVASGTSGEAEAFSDAVGPVTAAVPVNTSPPTISGDAVENETLSGEIGTWIGPNLIFTRQWQRSNGSGGYDDIPGATGATYTLRLGDVGHTIRLRVVASGTSGEAEAFSEPTDPVVAGAEHQERWLGLFVSRRPEAYKRATIRAQGFADSPLKLWVHEDLRGKPCPATAAGRKPGTRTVITGLPVDGAFREPRRPWMKKPGRHTYCAYLGPDVGTADNTSFKTRKVRLPLLRAPRARRTVAVALRRHLFANRVVENLERSCARRTRSKFGCRFASAFPGYSLRGQGSVERKRHVSYRFKVTVRGRTFVLTDENEGRFPG